MRVQSITIELEDGTKWTGTGPATIDTDKSGVVNIAKITVTESFDLGDYCSWKAIKEVKER